MMDREKVIKEFADFVKSFAKRDDTYYKGLFVSVLDLLKEQEAVLVVQRELMHLLFWCCGSCGVAITHGDKFCRNCGRQVKWDE